MFNNSKILSNNSGIAILLVMTSLVMLTILLSSFSYDTELNKIRTANMQDKMHARLNAESGLKLALAQLRLYQEMHNALEKNPRLKAIVKPSALEAMTTKPFLYPIPESKEMSVLQKDAIANFEKNTLINGFMSVNINKVKGFLNPNHMRIAFRKKLVKKPSPEEDEANIYPDKLVEEQLTELMRQLFTQQKQSDLDFENQYGDLSPEDLIKELRFYVNSASDIQDELHTRFHIIYDEYKITPKHAPINSLDELYLLLGWPDAVVDLIKDYLTVHEPGIISVNDLTEGQLSALFPELEPEQLKEFFIYRDGDVDLKEDPRPFADAKEFKSFLINNLGVPSATYEEREQKLAKIGLYFSTAGKLYKVISTGAVGRARYTINAFVDLPIKPTFTPPPKPPNKEKNKRKGRVKNDEQKRKSEKKEKKKRILLKPRVVEIKIS